MCFFFFLCFCIWKRGKNAQKLSKQRATTQKSGLFLVWGVTGAIYSLGYEFQGSSWLLDSEKVWNLKIQ